MSNDLSGNTSNSEINYNIIDENQFISKVNNDGTFEISQGTIDYIIENKPENINLSLPLTGGSVNVNLYRRNRYTHNFVVEDEFGNPINVELPEHYSGIIEGRQDSVASFSITKESVKGKIKDCNLNIHVDSVDGNTHCCHDYGMHEEGMNFCGENCRIHNHGIENMTVETDETSGFNFDSNIPYDNKELVLQNSQLYTNVPLNSYVTTLATKALKCYWELDYEIYTAWTYNAQALTNYITAVFDVISAAYEADGMVLQLSGLKIWTGGTAPYRYYNGYAGCPSSVPINDPYCALDRYAFYYLQVLGGKPRDKGDLFMYLHRITTFVISAAYSPLSQGLCNINDYSGFAAHRYLHDTIFPITGETFDPMSFSANSWSTDWNIAAPAHEMGHSLSLLHTPILLI